MPVATLKTQWVGVDMKRVSRGRSELFRCSRAITAGMASSNTVLFEMKWINELGGAQIREDKKLTEARIECVLVWANTNTHSASLADSVWLGWCQGDVHLWSRNIVCFRSVTACWGFARWWETLIHIDNHTLMVMVINHLCHSAQAWESRMD